MMRRVLFLAFDFPPQGGTSTLRVAKFVKYLPEYGWQPVVVCSDTAWNPDAALAAEIPASVIVRRVGWPALARRGLAVTRGGAAPTASVQLAPARRTAPIGALGRRTARALRSLLAPDPTVLWNRGALAAAERLLAEIPCAALVSTSPPHATQLAARDLHRHTGLPWIADFRDVWTVDAGAAARVGALGHGLQRRMEAQVLADCDRALLVTDALRDRTRDLFHLPAGKAQTLTNGFDPEEFAGPAPARDDGAFVLTYVGTVTSTRGRNAFPEGLRLALAQDAEFAARARVRFIGEFDPAYRARFAGLETNVEMLPYMPHVASIARMRGSHALLLILPDTDEGRMMYTNKLFEYLASRRPVLALASEGMASALLGQAGAGLTVPPMDAPAIARGLLDLFAAVRSRPDAYCADPTVVARFDRRVLAGQLAALLDEVSGTSRSGGGR